MNCDMIYDFYSVSCEFSLSPSLGEGIENTQEVTVDKNHIPSPIMRDSFYHIPEFK